ncbi:MAG: hypothetical protein GKS06_15875 [Acidobacteria bacterium]|nr:hypothetical protein [Acidobacteriota bacterium]
MRNIPDDRPEERQRWWSVRNSQYRDVFGRLGILAPQVNLGAAIPSEPLSLAASSSAACRAARSIFA